MKHLTVITLALALVGCANTGANYTPMIDTGSRIGVYEQDLAECQDYARRVGGASEGAAAGAFVGAIFGLLLNAAAGGGNSGALAGVGALSGAAQGASQGEASQRDIIVRCMSGRGYQVLR